MDRHNFDERCTRRLEWRRPDARTTLDGRHWRAGWPCHSASPPTPTAGQCLLCQCRSRPSRVAAVARHSSPAIVVVGGMTYIRERVSLTNTVSSLCSMSVGKNDSSNNAGLKIKGKVHHGYSTKRALIGAHLHLFVFEPVGREPQMSVMHGQCNARPTVTFPAGTKFCCSVTEAHVC